jgi:sarcosine oxidase subunit beta
MTVTLPQVAVVGAGVIGLSIAYHLALQGSSGITVYEKDAVGSGASGIAPGGVRRQWSTPVNCAMSEESLAFYRQINDTLEPQTELIFRECGYLFLAHSETALAELKAHIEVQHGFGIPSRIVRPDGLVDILPALRLDTVVGASYCPEDGYFDDPWGVIFAFARAARRRGVTIEKAKVLSLRRSGDGWELRLADGGTALAEQVIVTAGSDSVELVASVGVDLPIRAEPRYLFYSDPVLERICDPLVVSREREFAVKQMSDGAFLTSYLGAGREVREQMPEAWKACIAEAAEEILPALLDVSLTHLVKGYYDMTPDHQPIIGAVPGAEGVWVAAGLSGHGFMMAPAVGRAVADLLRGNQPAWYFQGLGVERFSELHLLTESQVI